MVFIVGVEDNGNVLIWGKLIKVRVVNLCDGCIICCVCCEVECLCYECWKCGILCMILCMR